MPSLAYVGSKAAASSIFYGLFNGQNGDAVYAIGAATRTGGPTTGVWSEYASNPVLTHGTGWESAHVKDPCLLWDGAQYVLYYSGYNGTGYQIGRATAASHQGPWTKYGSNPVLAFGAGGSFDESGLYVATVLHEPADTGKEWKVWYGATDASGNQTVGYAYSTNGTSFTKVGKVLDVGAGGAWDHFGISPNAIIKLSTTYYLFIAGRGSSGSPYNWQGGYATFTNPSGTYTKYASNPTIKHRSADSGTSTAFSSNIAVGATQVPMADTSPFHVGEAVVLVDGDGVSIPEIFYIVTLNSGTLLTLDHATVGAFRSGGGVFRSVPYNSVIARSILPNGADYEVLGTVFQPVEDLSVPGTKLREGSFGWVQTGALTGNWTYNYVAGQGLFFPLYSGSTGWHQYSAENPSVIAAP